MIIHSFKEKAQRDHAFDNTMGHWANKQKIDLSSTDDLQVKLKNYDEDLDLVGPVGSASVSFRFLIAAWN